MIALVTGDQGFIGSHVSRLLKADGVTVRGIDSLEPRVHGGNGGGQHVGDVGYDVVSEVEVVVHLAAQVGVVDSEADPIRYVTQNTVETTSFLDTLARLVHNRPGQLRRLVVASSMSVYGDPQQREPVTENHPCVPASVYGLTKYDQEMLCRLWGKRHGVPTVALRFFNVYGPGQALTNPYTGALANFANALLHDERPTVYEDGEQTRDFIYVDDVAAAVTKVVLTAGHDAVYNICTGTPTTVLEAAGALARALGTTIAPRITGTVRRGDIRHCVGSPARYAEEIGWTHAPTSFGDGIARYVMYLQAS